MEDTMADELRIGLTELLRKAHIEGGDAEFLKEGVRALSQALMEMEVEEHIGATRPRTHTWAQGSAQRL
jgi:transposase-like protein